MPRMCARFNSLTAVVLGVAATATPAVAALNCPNQPLSVQAAYVNQASDWREFDVTGRELVRESGTLRGPEVTVDLNCGRWQVQAQLSQLDGDRDYDGQTSTGVAIHSRSKLHQINRQIQARVNVTEAWRLGLRLSNQTTWRDIASVGGASGYPERFDWTLLSLGTQWHMPLGRGELILAGWTGAELDSSMILRLPGRDHTNLALGSIRQEELELGWRLPLSAAWSLQADVRYRRTKVAQGADVVITRNGLPVGVAHQPRTRTVDVPVAIRLGYQF